MNQHVPYGFLPSKTLGMVPMQSESQRAAVAFFEASQTLRRLAHRAKREALKWEAEGHHSNYVSMRLESDQLWRRAKFNLRHARIWSE